MPASAAADVLGTLGDTVAGTVVIDATNPLNDTYSDLTVVGTSITEQLAALAPQAKVVKAFNTVFASRHGNTSEAGQPLDGYYAGDDQTPRPPSRELLASLGYHPIDAGGLRMARTLEELALLNITLNARNGWSLAERLEARRSHRLTRRQLQTMPTPNS